MDLKTVILYGKAGSGKGTQSRLLCEYLDKHTGNRATYFETGAQLRTFAKQNNFTAKHIRKSLEEGSLVPEFIPVWVWTTFFMHHLTGEEHLVLDGLARRVDEVVILHQALKFYERHAVEVVVLSITDEEAFKRLKLRARADDDEKEIGRRLAWYQDNVEPAIEQWRKLGVKVSEIDGSGSIEETHQLVLKTLDLV